MADELTENPTVAQRLVAMELQQLRLAAGIDRKQVARELGCAISKLGHLETARNQPSYQDLETMTRLYGRPDRLSVLARRNDLGHRRGWWQNARNPDLDGPDSFGDYVGLEQGASKLLLWEPLLITGIFQTSTYAREIIAASDPHLNDEDISTRVNLRIRRQNIVDHTAIHLILGHSALYPVGTTQAWRDQLHHLIALATHSNITIQILPATAGAHPGLHGAFHILHFPADPEVHDPGLVYAETRLTGIWYDEANHIANYTTVFDQLASIALPAQTTTTYLAAMTKELAA